MAKALSQVYTQIRGSVGGVTYLANQWHQIVCRARTSPVDPQTPNQGIVRSSLALVSAYWKNLSDSVRTAWDEYAATCQYQGPFNTYTVPGRQMFVAVQTLVKYLTERGLFAFASDTSAPTTPGWLGVGPFSINILSAPGTGFSIAYQNFTGEDAQLFVERSFAQPVTRNRFKGPWLSSTAQCLSMPNGTSGLLDIDGLEDGKVYFVRLRAVTEDPPYRISSEYILRAVASVVAP